MKSRILGFLAVFLLIASTCFATQNTNKWELFGEQVDGYEIYVDTESIYVDDDGTVFFWLKYTIQDEQIMEDYQADFKHYLQSLGKDPALIKDKVYCVYKVHADLDNYQYEFVHHYWYNELDDSIVLSYESDRGWRYLEPESEMYENFKSLKDQAIINKG